MKETPAPQKQPVDPTVIPAKEETGKLIPTAKANGDEPAQKAIAPKAKPKPKVPKKPEKPKEPLLDNGDGTITDPNSRLMWKKSDAWIDTKKYYTWPSHQEYVEKINKEKFAGYDDWKIPSKADALTLFDKTKKCFDKNGTEFFIDPIFEEGGAGNTWIIECTDENITRYDWKTGVETSYGTAEIWASMRLMRKLE